MPNPTTVAPLRPLADTAPSAVVAGFIAMMTGYTSSLVLMFQAGQAAIAGKPAPTFGSRRVS